VKTTISNNVSSGMADYFFEILTNKGLPPFTKMEIRFSEDVGFKYDNCQMGKIGNETLGYICLFMSCFFLLLLHIV
jgi:hypothetical protein